MKEEWIIPEREGEKPTGCLEIGGKVRIEIRPQAVELDCTDENLSNEITDPGYRVGGRDANGKIIKASERKAYLESLSGNKAAEREAKLLDRAIRKGDAVENGETMTVLDRRSKFKPYVWGVYQWQDTGEVLEKDDGEDEPIWKWVLVDLIQDKEAALKKARKLAEAA